MADLCAARRLTPRSIRTNTPQKTMAALRDPVRSIGAKEEHRIKGKSQRKRSYTSRRCRTAYRVSTSASWSTQRRTR